jgi:hypothetical protein
MRRQVSEKAKGLIVALLAEFRKQGFDVKTENDGQARVSIFIHDWDDDGEHLTIGIGRSDSDEIDCFLPAGTVFDKGGSSDGRKRNHEGIA